MYLFAFTYYRRPSKLLHVPLAIHCGLLAEWLASSITCWLAWLSGRLTSGVGLGPLALRTSHLWTLELVLGPGDVSSLELVLGLWPLGCLTSGVGLGPLRIWGPWPLGRLNSGVGPGPLGRLTAGVGLGPLALGTSHLWSWFWALGTSHLWSWSWALGP